jgi:hypothetical protein
MPAISGGKFDAYSVTRFVRISFCFAVSSIETPLGRTEGRSVGRSAFLG